MKGQFAALAGYGTVFVPLPGGGASVSWGSGTPARDPATGATKPTAGGSSAQANRSPGTGAFIMNLPGWVPAVAIVAGVVFLFGGLKFLRNLR